MDREYANTVNMYKGLHENLNSLTTNINPLAPFEFKDEVEIEQEFTGDLINIDSTSSSSAMRDLLQLDSFSYSSMLENTSIVNSNDTMKDHHYVGDDEDSIFNIPPYAIAKYNFIAQNSNELSLKMGEMIYLSQHINEEWMLGDIDGISGLFPTKFVSIIVDCTYKQTDYSENVSVIYLFDEGSNYRVILTIDT